jgi:hypothetical protein
MKKSFPLIKSFALSIALALLAFHVGAAQPVFVDDSHKFDEFYGPNWESAMAHLDGFTISLNDNPNQLGVIIVYGGNQRLRGEAKAWSACVKDYLVKRRSITSDRLIILDGGYRKSLTIELWETTDRKDVPTPSQQIARKDVKFKNGKIGHWRRMCNS